MDQIEVTLKIPAPFYRVLEAVARAEKMPLRKMMMRDLVVEADCSMSMYHKIRDRLGIERSEREGTYQPQLMKMAGLTA